MSEIEKIERYIGRTGLSSFIRNRYQMIWHELRAVTILGQGDPCKAVSLAYTYGLAKGYRAAKAESKRVEA